MSTKKVFVYNRIEYCQPKNVQKNAIQVFWIFMEQLIDNTLRFCTVVRAFKPNSLSVNSPIMKTENHFTNFTFRVQPREVCAPCIPGNMLYGSHSSLRTQYII